MSRALRLNSRSPPDPARLVARTPSNLISIAQPGPAGTGPAMGNIGATKPPVTPGTAGRSAIPAVWTPASAPAQMTRSDQPDVTAHPRIR